MVRHMINYLINVIIYCKWGEKFEGLCYQACSQIITRYTCLLRFLVAVTALHVAERGKYNVQFLRL
jgi:hypothetical protein